MTTETKRDSHPILKDRVSLSPEPMKQENSNVRVAFTEHEALLLSSTLFWASMDKEKEAKRWRKKKLYGISSSCSAEALYLLHIRAKVQKASPLLKSLIND